MRAPVLLALAAVTLGNLGCGDDPCEDVNCSPCPPPQVALVVSDSVSGAAVPGAAVSGGNVSWTCAEVDRATRCTAAQELPSAAVILTVTAPGYVTQEVQLTPVAGRPSGCCPGCVSYQPDAVGLVRAR